MTRPSTRRQRLEASRQERRDAVVQVALSIIAEHGTAVTTAQIAKAAGVGEATIFRAFPDKGALLQACVAAVSDPTAVLRDLNMIDVSLRLHDRLMAAADVLEAYIQRMSMTLAALHASEAPGRRAPRSPAPPGRHVYGLLEQEGSLAATRQAIAKLVEPECEFLRTSVDVLVNAYLRLLFGRTVDPAERGQGLARHELIDLLLNGALRSPSSPTAPAPIDEPTHPSR